MSVPKFRIAICGGGIAGLALAISISRFSTSKDVIVDIYEAKQALTEIGAGITLWKRPFGVLRALALENDFMKICQSSIVLDEPSKSFLSIVRVITNQMIGIAYQYRKSDQKTGLHFYDMIPPIK